MPRLNNNENLDVRGTLDLRSGSVLFANGQVPRTVLAQNPGAAFPIDLTNLRTWDDFATNLPGTAATDDLAIIEGTFGTDAPRLQTGDLKAAGATTRYARFTFALPEQYVDGDAFTIRVRAGMDTTISDGTATVDIEAYRYDDDGGVGSDLCATAAQDINSLTKSDNDFTITPTGLSAGDVFDVRVAVAISDTAGATAVIGEISRISVLVDVR